MESNLITPNPKVSTKFLDEAAIWNVYGPKLVFKQASMVHVHKLHTPHSETSNTQDKSESKRKGMNKVA